MTGSDRILLGATRRHFLGGIAATGAASLFPAAFGRGAAFAQDASNTLIIAAPATPQGLDIEFDVSLGSIDVLGALYDYLLAYEKIEDPDAPGVLRENTDVSADGLALRGRLAESWELSPDGTRVVFKLREGVKSNWGNLLTAKDVKWTWDRKFHAGGQGGFQTTVLGLENPDQIKIEGDYVISFNLNKPNPLLLRQQCNLANPIYDATKCAEAGGESDPWAIEFLKNESAGFGPYKIAQLVRGQQAVFEARDDYWDEAPQFKRVIMREVPQSSSRFSLLQGGAVDIAQYLQPRELDSLKQTPTAAVDAVKSSYMIWLELNAEMAPFDNPDVRRAINYAIPRDEIVNTVYYGYADAQTAMVPYIYPMADTSLFKYAPDIARAKELLAAAGVSGPIETTLSYNAGDPTQEPIALLIQTALREIGVNLTLEKLPAGVFYENVTKRQKPMIFYMDSPWTPELGYATSLYFNSESYVNYSNYKNPKVDELIREGLATLDPEVQRAKYGEAQQILMDEAPWGLLAYPQFTLARKADLKGFTYYTSNNLRFQDFKRG